MKMNKPLIVKKEFRDLIFPLAEEEYHGLEASVRKYGVKDPLVVWQRTGKTHVLLDGHHRLLCIRKLGIKNYKVVKMRFSTKHEAINYILDLQMSRRNATPEGISYLRGIRYRNEKLAPHRPAKDKKDPRMGTLKTVERLAKQYKVGKNTIARDENFSEAVDKICAVYASGKKRIEIKHLLLTRRTDLTKKDIIALSILNARSIKNVLEKGKSLWEIKSELNKARNKVRIRNASRLLTPQDCKLYVGDALDISKRHIQPASVNCIITDPPYGRNGLHCYEKLGKIAQRILVPSGFCCFYTGKLHLDTVFEIMSKYLKYYWQIILLHHGIIGTGFNPITVRARKVNTLYKSILVFQNEPQKRTDEYFCDVIEGSGIEKNLHPWQQSEKELNSVVTKFSKIGTTVLDPYLGSGTTSIVCKKLGRKFVGIDINPSCIKETKIRLKCVKDHT